MKKQICAFTGSRADYYPAKDLFKSIRNDKDFSFKLIVTGAHLSKDFGPTYKDIEKDNFEIIKVPINLSLDSRSELLRQMGSSLYGFSKSIDSIRPDLCLVIGDRYESFLGALASYVKLIPIAHISGGEVTEGVLDEGFRHSITKFSQLHFTSLECYRKRVIQLGEMPNTVHTVGEIGLSNFSKLKFYNRRQIEEILKCKLLKNSFLVTYHPDTLSERLGSEDLKILLNALRSLKKTTIIITKPNADPGNIALNKIISNFVDSSEGFVKVVTTLGDKLYSSILNQVNGVIGNSSSGIWEVPSYKKGTINIGLRQKGRIRAKSVIDCDCHLESIQKAIKKLTSKEFQEILKTVENPYYRPNTCEKIIKVIKEFDLGTSTQKSFYDVD